jgi:hypothetical protein
MRHEVMTPDPSGKKISEKSNDRRNPKLEQSFKLNDFKSALLTLRSPQHIYKL